MESNVAFVVENYVKWIKKWIKVAALFINILLNSDNDNVKMVKIKRGNAYFKPIPAS